MILISDPSVRFADTSPADLGRKLHYAAMNEFHFWTM